MLKYAKIINEETKQCEVGIGTNVEFYKSIGMTEMEVVQAYNGKWYIKGFEPQQPVEEKQEQIREVRNSYLIQYVDPYQLILRWEALSEDQKIDIINYRQYLLDYTKEEKWWEQNPLTLDEWKEHNK